MEYIDKIRERRQSVFGQVGEASSRSSRLDKLIPEFTKLRTKTELTNIEQSRYNKLLKIFTELFFENNVMFLNSLK